MKLRNFASALAISAALAFGAPSAANAVVTSHCFNHTITHEFICHFYEGGSLLAIAGGGGVYWIGLVYQWF